MRETPATLIATLGSKAQIITLGLDCLRQQGALPTRLVVIHTRSSRPETAQALQRLGDDIPLHFPEIEYQNIELSQANRPLEDVTSPEQVDAAFRALYAQVGAAKRRDEAVHLLIAGGRRTLTVFGMAVAQMLFDDRDHLWHLASHPVLEQSGRLHVGHGEWARLIAIPVIPWGRLSPVFDALKAVDDPFAAAQRLGDLRLREQWDTARIFMVAKATSAEREVITLLVRDGLLRAEIAERLFLSPRTVEQHLRSAYRKAAEHWQVESVNQTQLVRLVIPYFGL